MIDENKREIVVVFTDKEMTTKKVFYRNFTLITEYLYYRADLRKEDVKFYGWMEEKWSNSGDVESIIKDSDILNNDKYV